MSDLVSLLLAYSPSSSNSGSISADIPIGFAYKNGCPDPERKKSMCSSYTQRHPSSPP
jgi:hypothetical protein